MTPSIEPAIAGARLTVDLDALVANWRSLGLAAAGAECAGVVKADAYGTGAFEAAGALARAGCRTFFVAHVGEGRTVRAAAPGATIYVLNGLLPDTASAYVADNLRPVLGSMEEIAEWREASGGSPAALHVDTGLARLGLAPSDALGGAVTVGFEPALLMSHFVASEEPDAPVNARQIALFDEVRRAFPATQASLANSSGIYLPGCPHHDLVRPGYALYGGNPTPGRDNPVRPVVRLDARVIQVRDVPDGSRAGYNGRWTARGPRRLATLCLGYADGYPRGSGGTDEKRAAGVPFAEAVVAGVRCPFVGTVSMDLTIVDVTQAPPGEARRGAMATLIGDGLEIDEVGVRAGTIGYEILTSLGRRYARHYSGGRG
jgi:alanine racemase